MYFPDCEIFHTTELVLIIFAPLLSTVLLLWWQEQSSEVMSGIPDTMSGKGL